MRTPGTSSRNAGPRTPKRAALAGLAVVAAVPLLLSACSSSPADSKVGIVAADHTPSAIPGVDSTAGASSATASDTPSARAAGSPVGTATGGGAKAKGPSGAGPGTGTPSAGCSAKTPKGWGDPVRSVGFSTSTSAPSGFGIYHDTSVSLRDPSQVKVSGGSLQLVGTVKNGKSIGGGVNDQFAQKYGRWEACIRATVGDGYYPAITLWPANNNWPTDGEIDLLESTRGNRQDNIFFIHNNAANNKKGTHFTLDLTQWRQFAVDWTPKKVVYYVDGVARWSVTSKSLVPTRTAMHMTFQLDPRNKPDCGGKCRNASTPAHPTMFVNWMKAFRYSGQSS